MTRFAKGLGFVPGLVATTPLAALGLAARLAPLGRRIAVFAIAALPLVWAFQYTGGAAPQWGGRYLLVSGLLLGVVGIVSLGRIDMVRARGLVVLAFVGDRVRAGVDLGADP